MYLFELRTAGSIKDAFFIVPAIEFLDGYCEAVIVKFLPVKKTDPLQIAATFAIMRSHPEIQGEPYD